MSLQRPNGALHSVLNRHFHNNNDTQLPLPIPAGLWAMQEELMRHLPRTFITSEQRAGKPQAESRVGMRREDNAHQNQNGKFRGQDVNRSLSREGHWQLLSQEVEWVFFSSFSAKQKKYFCICNDSSNLPWYFFTGHNPQLATPISPWQFSISYQRSNSISNSNELFYCMRTPSQEKKGKLHYRRKHFHCKIQNIETFQ